MKKLATVYAILLAAVGAFAGEQKYANRSIYVPIHFSVCPHLNGGVFWLSNVNRELIQPVAVAQEEHKFQFTWYADRKELLPEKTIIMFVAELDGKPIRHPITITASDIYLSPSKVIHFDMDAFEKWLKTKKLDFRHKTTAVKVDCPHDKETPAVATGNH